MTVQYIPGPLSPSPGPSRKTWLTHEPSWGEASRCDESLELPMNGTKADVGVRRRKSMRRERQARTGQQGVNLALGQGKRSDLAVCQEVFPSPLPWGKP